MAHVRLFAAAADAVGMNEAVIAAGTTAELLEALSAKGAANAEQVLAQCSLLVDSVATTSTDSVALQDDSRVDVLPPFAGG